MNCWFEALNQLNKWRLLINDEQEKPKAKTTRHSDVAFAEEESGTYEIPVFI